MMHPLAGGLSGPLGVGRRVAAAGLTLVFHDEFTDTDATVLSSHTPAPVNSISGAWSVALGDWKITSNQAYITASLANSRATISVPTSIAKISCVLSLAANATSQIRGVMIGGKWVGYRQSDNTMSYGLIVSTVQGSTAWDGGGLTNRLLEITVDGSVITATIDAMSLSWTETLTFPVAVGFAARFSTDKFDDLKVWQ